MTLAASRVLPDRIATPNVCRGVQRRMCFYLHRNESELERKDGHQKNKHLWYSTTDADFFLSGFKTGQTHRLHAAGLSVGRIQNSGIGQGSAVRFSVCLDSGHQVVVDQQAVAGHGVRGTYFDERLRVAW